MEFRRFGNDRLLFNAHIGSVGRGLCSRRVERFMHEKAAGAEPLPYINLDLYFILRDNHFIFIYGSHILPTTLGSRIIIH